MSDDIPNNDKVMVKRERNLGSSEDEEREDGEMYEDSIRSSIRKRNSERHLSKEDEDERNMESDDDRGRGSVTSRRRSSSDPVNLSLGKSQDDSDDGNIDVETIGSAPSKV